MLGLTCIINLHHMRYCPTYGWDIKIQKGYLGQVTLLWVGAFLGPAFPRQTQQGTGLAWDLSSARPSPRVLNPRKQMPPSPHSLGLGHTSPPSRSLPSFKAHASATLTLANPTVGLPSTPPCRCLSLRVLLVTLHSSSETPASPPHPVGPTGSRRVPRPVPLPPNAQDGTRTARGCSSRGKEGRRL